VFKELVIQTSQSLEVKETQANRVAQFVQSRRPFLGLEPRSAGREYVEVGLLERRCLSLVVGWLAGIGSCFLLAREITDSWCCGVGGFVKSTHTSGKQIEVKFKMPSACWFKRDGVHR
jgi:hypothetical protein